MKMTNRWTWIRVSQNSTDHYNEPDFLAGHVFWFIDNITSKYYNVKKDDTGKIIFSNDLFHDLNKYEAESIFLEWIKITAPDLYQKDISIFFESKTKKVVVHQPTPASSPYTKPAEMPHQQSEPNKKTPKNLGVTAPKTGSPKQRIYDICNNLIANPISFFGLPEGTFSERMANIILGKFGLSSDDALNVVKRWFEMSCSISNSESGPLTLKELMLLGIPVNINPKYVSGKYNKSLLERYIKATDTAKDDVSSLEDDFYFMMDVINLSGDKRMFHFCSENQKTSFEMVWFMINRFKTNIEFITELVENYLKANNNLEERLSILALISALGLDIKNMQTKS